jgi:hypothetical protein
MSLLPNLSHAPPSLSSRGSSSPGRGRAWRQSPPRALTAALLGDGALAAATPSERRPWQVSCLPCSFQPSPSLSRVSLLCRLPVLWMIRLVRPPIGDSAKWELDQSWRGKGYFSAPYFPLIRWCSSTLHVKRTRLFLGSFSKICGEIQFVVEKMWWDPVQIERGGALAHGGE